MAAAAEVISWVERRCGGGRYTSGGGGVSPKDNLMCTTGNIQLWPNAFNVIPGSANFTLDIRHVLFTFLNILNLTFSNVNAQSRSYMGSSQDLQNAFLPV